MTTNTEIGSLLAAARGDLSQRSFGSSMRGLGHKWNHLTVASIERGERPLRLNEAVDAARLLDVPLLSLAGSSGVTEDADELTALRRFKRGVDKLYGDPR
jgi:hypothetical protein